MNDWCLVKTEVHVSNRHVHANGKLTKQEWRCGLPLCSDYHPSHTQPIHTYLYRLPITSGPSRLCTSGSQATTSWCGCIRSRQWSTCGRIALDATWQRCSTIFGYLRARSNSWNRLG